VRVLILGASGTLGHQMLRRLAPRFPDTWAAIRGRRADIPRAIAPLFDPARTVEGADALDLDRLDVLLRGVGADAVVNCAGAIKQKDEAGYAFRAWALNAALPHRLAALTAATGARLIHLSTDCVFSGRRGHYTETDAPDPEDVYGRSKFGGEVVAPHCLTLRTSFVGREAAHHVSLLDWLLAHRGGTVRGYTNVWWSGVTASHLADVVGDVLAAHPALHGLFHLAGERLTKHDLLVRLRDGLGLDVAIEPDPGPRLDRSLDGARFAAATGYRFPGWDALVAALAADPTPYDLPAGGTPR